jgi:peptide/nickel transport system substrate-binding protein
MNQTIKTAKTYWILMILPLLIFLFGGCSKAGEFFQYQADPEKQVEIIEKGILSMDRISTLNPVTSKDRDVYYLNKLLYRSLFQLDETLLAQEDLVRSFALDEASRTLTLELKQDARWADGNPITPADVQFTIEAYKRASYSGQTLYQAQVEPISQVRIQGDSISIRYGKDNEFSLEDLTFPILSQKSFGDYNKALRSDLSFLPMTSGPYQIARFNPYSELVLEGNPQFAGEVPRNQILFRIIPKESENLNLIDPNLITVAFSERLTRDVDYSNLKADMGSFLSNEAEWLGFNTTRAPFDKKEMRQALALALNTTEILDYCYHGNGVLTDSLYYPGYWGSSNGGDLFPQDQNEAVKLLRELGYQDRDGDGILEDGAEKKLTAEILVNEGNESRKLAAEQMALDLTKIGLEITIRTEPAEVYQRSLQTLNYDLYLGGAVMGENYDLRPLLQSFTGNPTGFVNPELDSALNILQSMKNREIKLEAFKKAKKLLGEELPYYPLVYKTYGVLTSLDFQGTVKPVFYHIYQGAPTWSYQRELPVVEEPAQQTETAEENPS